MEFVITIGVYLFFLAIWAFFSMVTLFMMFRYHGLSLAVWRVSLLYAIVSAGVLLTTVIVVSRLSVDWTSVLYFFHTSL